MAEVKVTELTEVTTLDEYDVLPIVSDPAGTPATKKVTVKKILDERLHYSIVATGDFALTANTTEQNAFDTTGDVFTVQANTTYMFEGMYLIEKSGASCTVATGLSLGGSASITSLNYTVDAVNGAVNTTGTSTNVTYCDSVTATIVNATSTGNVMVKFRGLIRMNAGGTVTPRVKFGTAGPTSPVMAANSYFMMTPIGTDTENTKGDVA